MKKKNEEKDAGKETSKFSSENAKGGGDLVRAGQGITSSVRKGKTGEPRNEKL